LTFNWEQIDAPTDMAPLNQESVDGPLVIANDPMTSGNYRSIPEVATALAFRGSAGVVDVMNRMSSRARAVLISVR
jgi:hypothetical protein